MPAQCGAAIAPYADRLLPFLWQERELADDIVQTLAGAVDPRALPWHLRRAKSF